MQLGVFGKALVGAATGTALVVGATAALAGTGVGGVFNLGQTNTVDETSTLTGAKAGPMLQVTNANTAAQAAGVAISVPSGRAPLTVNRNTRIPNLNADLVDGYHASWFSRAAQGTSSVSGSGASFTTLATATLAVPQTGWVRVDGRATASAGCSSCYAHLRLHDVTGDTDAPVAVAQVASTTPTDAAMSAFWIFPATVGTRSYTVDGGQFGGSVTFENVVVTAQFLPFGWAGGGSGLAPPAPPGAAMQATPPAGGSQNGTRPLDGH